MPYLGFYGIHKWMIKRRYPRMTFLAFATVFSPKTGVSFEGSIRNLGLQGLGMFSKGYLEVNSQVEILVTFRNGSGATREERIYGKVVGINVGVDGNTFGIEFNEKIKQEKNPALYQYLHQTPTKTS